MANIESSKALALDAILFQIQFLTSCTHCVETERGPVLTVGSNHKLLNSIRIMEFLPFPFFALPSFKRQVSAGGE